ncbi:efflux RND transporter periplasmic adaptor subunit [Haliea sp. E17]|uniref:efflux RND transporter periplasmic adaptor subunit n=1 Tax=Haliea sp. E17 TaxID=3401576 RepID=UPI003AACD1F3
MKTSFTLIGVLAAGVAVGALLGNHWSAADPVANNAPAEEQPLYWVAPMDPNYRRDQPGKSPMGMDLVPVYASQQPAGTVQISPAVVNKLGVRSAPARREILPVDIRTVGYVQYDEDRLVHVHPRVEGWIEKLYVKAAGDPVAPGQPLYDLYSPELVNAQEEFLLALRRDNATLQRAAENRLRALQLSDAFIETLKRERQVQQTVTYLAPGGGVVDALKIREGFFIGPRDTLMAIAALDEVWVEAEVFERQAARIRRGLPVTMALESIPGKQWSGRVDYVYPSLDPATRTLRVRLRFANDSRELRPNMFAQVTIHAGDDQPVLAVPREALIRSGEGERLVLALGEGRFRAVPVRAGRYGGELVEILDGIGEGDEVVTSAQFLLDSESSRRAEFARMEVPGGAGKPASEHAAHSSDAHANHAATDAPDAMQKHGDAGAHDHD